jgi:hypothetical protein
MEELVRTEPYWMKTCISLSMTFYEDYADGQTRSVSVPIDSVKIDVQDRQIKR